MLRRLALAVALVAAPLTVTTPAQASHNPGVGCWYIEGTQWDNPNYGPFWQQFADGWWYYYWWEHWEQCEDGWNNFAGWHRHWTHYGW